MSRTDSIRRVTRVIHVLADHGLGYFLQRARLSWHMPFAKRVAMRKRLPKAPEVRMREAMEQLGGIYLKLGQFLSMRQDLAPEQYCEEFKKLLDRAEPLKYETVKHVLEKELHKPLAKVFSQFDKKPLGSASIAQVHYAKLKNGKQVAVKVQRPKVAAQFRSDIDILYYLAHKFKKHFTAGVIDPVIIVKEFERYTLEELNFLQEADNIHQFSTALKGLRYAVVPKVYPQYCTKHVLVMEYIRGAKLSEVAHTLSEQNRQLIADKIVDAAIHMVYDKGIFHADAHAGNILVLPRNKLALLDFGIVGKLDEKSNKLGLDLYLAIIARDIERVQDILLHVGRPTPATNYEQFRQDVETIMHDWHRAGVIRVTTLMHRLFVACVKNNIRMPTDLVLVGKALVTIEGTCRQLVPDFDFVEEAKPKMRKLLERRRAPQQLINRFLKSSQELRSILAELPRETLDFVEKLKREPFRINMRNPDARHLGMDINTSSNRLSIALIIAALIVTGAMLVDLSPQVGGLSYFSVFSMSIAFVLGITLVTSMAREGTARHDPHKKAEHTR